jgi:site-specific recombinase XerD
MFSGIAVRCFLLQAGVDTAVIALWLGRVDIRSTNVYLHADMTNK